MAPNIQEWLKTPIIRLSSIDSTNNYAMQLVNADKAQAGLAIVTDEQTKGKGQRGKIWMDEKGKSVLMSIILTPTQNLDHQFTFSAMIAVAVARTLMQLNNVWMVNIKWPNDIIVNDKKAGGILIENVLRGNQWIYAIVGIGINVRQDFFPAELGHATSLKLASGKDFFVDEIVDGIRRNIFEQMQQQPSRQSILQEYNVLLFKSGQSQMLVNAEGENIETIIHEVLPDGRLSAVLKDGTVAHFTHGSVTWQY